jgi:hypothetical protein
MPELYPTWGVPSLVTKQSAQSPVQYGKAPAFDLEAGDFMLDGAGRVPIADGYSAWAAWCLKTIQTERLSALVYSRRYGTELEQARRHVHREVAQSEIARAITEAMLVDPRTKGVQDFAFDWNGDELSISLTVVPTVGTAQRLKGVTLNG